MNIKKTKYIVFHSSKKNIDHIIPQIILNNTVIERVDNFNFLGITLKQFIPLFVLKTLYCSLILPYFTYGILSWGGQLTKLTKLQKKAVRVVTNSIINDHTEPLFKFLDILKLEDLYKLNILKFYFNYCHNLLPYFFQNLELHKRSDLHSYNVRYKQMLHVKKVKSKIAEQSIEYSLPKIVNLTTPHILDKTFTHSTSGFCHYVKQYFIQQYNINCTVEYCYVCNR